MLRTNSTGFASLLLITGVLAVGACASRDADPTEQQSASVARGDAGQADSPAGRQVTIAGKVLDRDGVVFNAFIRINWRDDLGRHSLPVVYTNTEGEYSAVLSMSGAANVSVLVQKFYGTKAVHEHQYDSVPADGTRLEFPTVVLAKPPRP